MKKITRTMFFLIFFLHFFIEYSLRAGVIQNHTQGVVQPPRFVAGDITFLSSEEIITELRPILRARLASTKYDRLSASLKLIQHLIYVGGDQQNQEGASRIACLSSFKYDFSIDETRGGPCVPLTIDILNCLPQHMLGYIAAAKLPKRYHQFGFPLYCHTAVLIHYQNPDQPEDWGYIILDPSFDFHEPIHVKGDGSVFDYLLAEKGLWSFRLVGNEIVCQITPSIDSLVDSSHFILTYRTDQIVNPIQASATPMLIADRRLSLLSRLENGRHIAHLNVELDKERVIWDLCNLQFPPIPFFEIENGWSFPHEFANALSLSSVELTRRVTAAIKHKKILNRIFADYLMVIKTHGDYSITGPLDPHLLEAHLLKLQEP